MSGYVRKEYAPVISSAIANEDVDIHDINLLNRRFRFDRIEVITIGTPYVSFDSTVDSEYHNAWKNDVGGIFVKDLKAKSYDLYSEMFIKGKVGANEVSATALIRRITPDIEQKIKSSNVFVTVTIGDYDYLIMKVIQTGSSYFYESSFTECIVEKDYEDIYNEEYYSDLTDEDSAEPLYIDESSETEYNFFDEDE